MSQTVIQVEHLWKEYRLGVVNHHTLALDLQSWWARVRRREDPNSIVGKGGSRQNGGERFWALKDLCFEVRQGDVMGIIGRNGAGKSTLLKVLSQVTAPTRGEARFRGRIASLLEVGTGFHPELTGRENVFLNGAILGMSKADIRSRFDEIVAFAEVGAFIDTPVKRYSSGMYVRLAFAVAAHLEPEILVVDEVLAVGDVQFQAKCLGKMQDVGKQGRTVLFVSHNMQAIRQLCHRAILLREGEIVVDDAPSTAIAQYLDQGNQAFTGKSMQEIIRALPPDPAFRLEGISLRQEGRSVEQSVENGKPLEMEIRYQVLQRTTGLRVFIDLYDDQGTLLFRSFNDEDGDGIPSVDVGCYLSKTELPADLLAPTAYTLKIFATIFNVRTFYPEGITIALRVERTGKSNRAYLAEPIRGRLAPWLRWETTKMSEGGEPAC